MFCEYGTMRKLMIESAARRLLPGAWLLVFSTLTPNS